MLFPLGWDEGGDKERGWRKRGEKTEGESEHQRYSKREKERESKKQRAGCLLNAVPLSPPPQAGLEYGEKTGRWAVEEKSDGMKSKRKRGGGRREKQVTYENKVQSVRREGDISMKCCPPPCEACLNRLHTLRRLCCSRLYLYLLLVLLTRLRTSAISAPIYPPVCVCMCM